MAPVAALSTSVDPSSPLKFKAEFPKVPLSREEDDFYFTDSLIMHTYRQREMIKKYGKAINPLMGIDPWTKWIVIAVTIVHIAVGVYASKYLSGWSYFLVAYFIGGTASHNLFLSVHEVTHYLAFKTKKYNDWLAIFSNIPICVPYAMAFKEHHHDHHRYLGWDGMDPDVPTYVEAKLFKSFFGKLFFVVFQVYFYAIRPTFANPLKPNKDLLLNFVVIAICDVIMWNLWGLDLFIYFAISFTLGAGITPVSGHFISEHYVLSPDSYQETHSYYGILNWLTWNVGYHVEHHDFPNIPATQLWRLHAIAPEYYQKLRQTPSWFASQMQFLFDPNINLYCRMKRERGASGRTGKLVPTTSDARMFDTPWMATNGAPGFLEK